MPTEQNALDARQNEIQNWLAPGVDIAIYEPSARESLFRAVITEFDLTGEGATYEEAYEAVINRFTDFLDRFIVTDLPLPDRGVWRAKHPRPSDGDHD